MSVFLGLPVEIRYQLYLHVLDTSPASPGSLPIETYVATGVYLNRQSGWYQRVARPETPWLDLMLVSKAVQAELTTLFESNAVRNDKSLTTYHAHLTPRTLEWLKVSVPETFVRHLHVTVACTGLGNTLGVNFFPNFRNDGRDAMLIGMLYHFLEHGPGPSERACTLSLPLENPHVHFICESPRAKGTAQHLANMLRVDMDCGNFDGHFKSLTLECEGEDFDGMTYRSTRGQRIKNAESCMTRSRREDYFEMSIKLEPVEESYEDIEAWEFRACAMVPRVYLIPQSVETARTAIPRPRESS